MKKLYLPLFLLLFVVGFASAQRTVTGTVTNVDGDPLIGASILVRGTTIGTVADFDGTYSLDVPEGSNVLVVSFTGYTEKQVEIGVSNVVDVLLEEGIDLGEVVVTGLGIRREKKALGYGVSTIGAADIEARPQADIARLLRGKATGVDITQTSGIAGSGTNIIIRGYSSISGSNQPLFVIDGVPFNTSTNNDRDFNSGAAAASSRFLDLDPNNIAEINILKGLSATVLYGEAGRNGVILVTTKNGSIGADSNKKFEVSVTQTIARTEVSNIPDFQNTFGNGFSGDYGLFFSNWGPSFDTRGSNGIAADGTVPHPWANHPHFTEYVGQRFPYQAYESVENFFEPGLTANTSVAIQNNLGNGSAISATYSYLNDEGFTPDLDELRGGGSSNFVRKHNLGLGATTKLANGLNIRATFNYIDSDRRNPPAGTSFGSGGFAGTASLFSHVLFTPRSVDLMNLPYQSPVDGSHVYYRGGGDITNPRWTLNNASENEDIRRFFSTIEANYQLAPWLNVLYRFGADQYTQKNQFMVNKGGRQIPDGIMVTSERLNRIADHVLNFMWNFKLSDDWAIDGIIGTNLRREVQDYAGVSSTQQFVFNLFTHNNYINHNGFSATIAENTIGAYGTATVGFRNFAYLNLQARNDWTSTLESGNNSILYPSVSVSLVPTEMFAGLQNNPILNYLKLRAGYGTSAGYPDPYQTRNTLETATNVFVTRGGAVLNSNSVSNRLGNPNLQAELIKELEFGVEARFLQNRIGVDLSVYDKTSSDLIIDLDLDPATGFTNTTVNAAQVTNKGIELGLNITPVQGNLTWNFTLNYTKNKPTVDKIFEGVDQVLIAGFTNQGNFAVPGEPYGVIKGSAFARGPNGGILVNNVGSYVVSPDLQTIGNPNPNYTLNWINDISYKGLSLGWQWDYTDGGDIYSSTTATMFARGNTVDSDVDRFLPLILPGELADGTTNNIQTYIGDAFFDGYFGADEGSVFDGTLIRLRQVSLAYVLPERLLAKTPFGRIGITLSGENLWYDAVNFPDGVNFDPEVLSLGVGNGRGFDYFTGPTAKKYGVTINATF